jgi:hypothetical protein
LRIGKLACRTPLERRQFAKEDYEDLLGEVIDLVVQMGEAR